MNAARFRLGRALLLCLLALGGALVLDAWRNAAGPGQAAFLQALPAYCG